MSAATCVYCGSATCPGATASFHAGPQACIPLSADAATAAITARLQAAGGPAFPVSLPGVGDNGWHGMTLRDWFAGQALVGLAPQSAAVDSTARYAYRLADAMLAARGGR